MAAPNIRNFGERSVETSLRELEAALCYVKGTGKKRRPSSALLRYYPYSRTSFAQLAIMWVEI
jgi:hypothetical protein